MGVGVAALLALGGCGGDGDGGQGGSGGAGGIGGGGGAPECDSAEMCDDDNECTVNVCTDDGVCENDPVADETTCATGICVTGTCEPVEAAFPCTEAGIREAVSLGGGPYGFSCDGEQTVATEADILISDDVVLDGLGRMTLDGNDEHRLFSIADGATVELRRFALTRGAALEGGGGAIVNSGALSLVDSEVSASAAETFGGGITNFGEMTIAGSTVSGNRSGSDGGGIMNTGMLAMTSTTVSGSEADGDGGGLMNTGALTMTSCTVSQNEAAQDGGGIANFNVMMLVNSTISGNTASAGDGGGIWNNSVMTMSNGTLSGNQATAGDAIGNGGVAMMVLNTLIDGGCSGTDIDSDGHNLESSGDTCGLDDPTDLTEVSASDLQLGLLQDNGGPTETHALGESSVAIDAIATPMCVVDEDQRGIARPQGSGCDIGAVEQVP
jgi:hypothetical protein